MKKPGISVGRVGLTVKALLFAFPGHLGMFLKVFQSGIARALAGNRGLLPVRIPEKPARRRRPHSFCKPECQITRYRRNYNNELR